MTPTERQNFIIELLEKRKIISTKELQSLVFCSISTLRRDLITLESQGKIHKKQGEVILNTPKNTDYDYEARIADSALRKKKIAEIASTFIGPSQSYFMDSSTTVAYLAPYFEDVNNIQIITNSVSLPDKLNQLPNLSLFVTGGQVAYRTKSILDNFSINFINKFYTDVTFMSCKGIDNERCYDANENQTQIKQEMLKNTKTKVLLVDSTKFYTTHFIKLADFKDIDYIITDKKPPKAFLEQAEDYCEVLYS